MILDPHAIVAGYPFVARRFGRVPVCDASAVERCCERANELAGGDPRIEPAALFFAFADRRRAFPFAWKLMARVLSQRQASVVGLELDAASEALDALCTDVLYRRVSWDAVRAWFAPRLRPRSASP